MAYKKINLKVNPEIRDIQKIVAEEMNTPDDYCNNRVRNRLYCDARHLFSYVLIQLYPKMSYDLIGTITGKRTHASVINSKRIVENLLDTDDETKEFYSRIYNRSVKVKGGNTKIYKIDIAVNTINQHLHTGKFDIIRNDDNGLSYGICVDKYIWNDDETISKVIEQMQQQKIPISYYYDKKNKSKYVMVSGTYFI